MSELQKINKAKQLLVEGDDADCFFSALLKNLNINDIQIQNYGGNDELKGFLKQFRIAPGFLDKVECIGIIRDAEKNPKAAFQSISGFLKTANLPVPKKPSEITDTQPRVSVYILPDAKTKGMIETICISSVKEDPAMECVNTYIKCLKDKLNAPPKNLEKARLQAFLASRKKVPRKLGLAAKQNVWPWDSPVFENVKNFLNSL